MHHVLSRLGLTFYYRRERRRSSRNRGPGYAVPLQVVIPFRSSFGLVFVLPGRLPEPKDEAAEESEVDEPELGKLELDKLVPDKLEVGFDLAFSAAIFVSKEEVIELDDSLRWVEVSQSLCSIDGITMSQSQTVIEGINLCNGQHVMVKTMIN
uniref:Uncharacterized protein n=1 Tax=Tanacetum cinerariifolium TaxID=118510 RepID=A0A6L2N6L3_TANCI|nr:hypothetical protein [Tanacetum cinerariifolium]